MAGLENRTRSAKTLFLLAPLLLGAGCSLRPATVGPATTATTAFPGTTVGADADTTAAATQNAVGDAANAAGDDGRASARPGPPTSTTPPDALAAAAGGTGTSGTPAENDADAAAAGSGDATAAQAPADLLARIRREFRLPAVNDAAVTRELEWFAKNHEYLDRVFRRAEPYLPYIVEALNERGMPLDFALLPVVESAFDPFAYSHGRAAGLWQIIPGTGRRLGLKQNWWFDGRRDVPESTRAALDYLQMLHEQFGGDWLLAVAGYNSGEGNVARAIRRAEAGGRPTDFWSIRAELPTETRTYVPRLIAIRDLVAAPADWDIELPAIADEPAFVEVDTGSQIDMALAAELARVDIDTLYALNAGINRWATDPDGPHRLLIPAGQAERFELELANLDARDRVRWTLHRIQGGETLSQLAEKYHTTPSVLREINGLTGNLIRAGQDLIIPHATESPDAYRQSLDERRERQRNRERDGERRTHKVGAGESLWSIARRYDVPVRELASWNAMAPGDVLRVGRELNVWTDGATAAATPATPVATSQIRRIEYVVRRGDSLASIAQRFRVTVGKLVEWNKIDPKRYLQPGQRLVMHVDVTEQSS